MRQWTLQNTNPDKDNRRRWWRRRQWRRQQQTVRFNNELQQTSTSNWEKNPSFQRYNTNKNRKNTQRYGKGYCLRLRSSKMLTNLTPTRTLALDKHFSEKSGGKISCSTDTNLERWKKFSFVEYNNLFAKHRLDIGMTTDFMVGLTTHAQERPINVQLEFTITFHLWRGKLVIKKMSISIADNYVTNIIPVRTLSDVAQQLTGKNYVASWTAARHITASKWLSIVLLNY